jgi:hypothetical protein
MVLTVSMMGWCSLVAATSPGDFNDDGKLSASDVNQYAAAIRSGVYESKFNLDLDSRISSDDLRYWLERLFHTYMGDSNLDKDLTTSDLVHVFQIGEYEDLPKINSVYTDGDWDGDSEFTSGDFVAIFNAGCGFHFKCTEVGPRPGLPVPEPSLAATAMVIAIVFGLAAGRGRRPCFRGTAGSHT